MAKLNKIFIRLQKIWKKFREENLLPFVIVFTIFFLLAGGYFVAKKSLADRLPFGIQIANADFSLATTDEASREVFVKIDELLTQPIQLTAGEQTFEILPTEIDAEISPETTLATARQNLVDFGSLDFPVEIDETKLREKLLALDPSLETPPAAARVAHADDGSLAISPEIAGRETDFAAAAREIRRQLGRLQPVEILLATEEVAPPAPTAAQLEKFAPQLAEIVAAPLTLKTNEYTRFDINLADRLSWLDFGMKYRVGETDFVVTDYQNLPLKKADPVVLVDPAAVDKFVRSELGPLVARLASPAKISRDADGQITFDGVAENGRLVDIPALTEKIQTTIETGNHEIEIPFTPLPAPLTISEDLKAEGFVALIGSAETNYDDSSRNRIHNVLNAAEILDGVIVPAGAEFSFNDALGPVNGATGYRNELVIKEGELVPEMGGGVCQVSTTTFRAALDAGLPITAQRPHTFKVSHYFPPGLDATVYPGSANLKFVNDTAGPILIQLAPTNVAGDHLRVNIFGTPDDRKVALRGPFYPDGSPITDIRHAGMKMFWTREVNRGDGEPVSEKYSASYSYMPKD